MRQYKRRKVQAPGRGSDPTVMCPFLEDLCAADLKKDTAQTTATVCYVLEYPDDAGDTELEAHNRQMNARTYVLIFVAWAVLTIITPTLIFLSASSRPEDTDGLLAEAVKLRRLSIPLNPKHATWSSSNSRTTYGRGLGFWDLIGALTSFPGKHDSKLLDDPWEGGHAV
uniref:Uncharacterized protein n=1 Tax=Kalanchoe fedtschenkoi TaxID=63787 RepID=A0A7N0TYV4_KALFE